MLLISTLACGNSPSGNECIQTGPQVGYSMRALDTVIITGFAAEMPNQIDILIIGGAENWLGLDASHYPQTCFSPTPDRPNYRLLGWLDSSFYLDGGPPPDMTYCMNINDTNCHPQPNQPQGQVFVTLYDHQNNVAIIPFSP